MKLTKISLYAMKCALLVVSLPVSAAPFFWNGEEEQAQKLEREEQALRIQSLREAQNKRYTELHFKAVEYFNSDEDPIAIDSQWSSSTNLRIGVVRRSSVDTEYARKVCTVIESLGLEASEITVNFIYLPSLMVYQSIVPVRIEKCVRV